MAIFEWIPESEGYNKGFADGANLIRDLSQRAYDTLKMEGTSIMAQFYNLGLQHINESLQATRRKNGDDVRTDKVEQPR